MIAVGILSYMEANPPATEGDTYKNVLIRLDAMEKRIDNATAGPVGYWYRTEDIDGSLVTPLNWMQVVPYGTSPTDENTLTIKKRLRE